MCISKNYFALHSPAIVKVFQNISLSFLPPAC